MLKKIFATLLALLAAAAFAAVDVNKASQAELESIKGIGPALSQRLLDERKKSTFKDWPDVIERVKGIGSGNATRFSNGGLTVDGTAYAGAPAATPASGNKARSAASRATAPASGSTPAADRPAVSRAASGSDRTARKTADAASASRAAATAAPGASAAKAGAKP